MPAQSRSFRKLKNPISNLGFQFPILSLFVYLTLCLSLSVCVHVQFFVRLFVCCSQVELSIHTLPANSGPHIELRMFAHRIRITLCTATIRLDWILHALQNVLLVLLHTITFFHTC